MKLALAVASLFLAFHLFYLPASLEDLDSINFALGLRQFDVAQHRPHPPGYPLYILIGKAVHTVVPSEAAALGVVSACAGAIAVFALVALFAAVDPKDPARHRSAIAAAIVTVTAPLYWFTAARPLSDSLGLAAAVGVQALTLSAKTNRDLVLAACFAGLAIGIRSQVAWLTVPLLLLVLAKRRADGPAVVGRAAAGFALGGLVWSIPLVILTGGPAPYGRALFDQGAEDFSGIAMLWTTPTLRQLALAVSSAALAPWAIPAVAVAMLAAAAVGFVVLLRTSRGALATMAFAFGPYLAFNLLFQEAVTTRYALPLVVPVAYLAVRGVALAGPIPSLVAIAAVALFDAHVGGTSVAAYSAQKAPVFRLLEDMQSSAIRTAERPALAMDRRQHLDLRRPMQWAADELPAFHSRLSAPPQHEWLELVKYWNDGGRMPVWFVTDQVRTDIDLVQHPAPTDYRWGLPHPTLLSGTRPGDLRWFRIERPEWYLGEGWSLTPEVAGVASADNKGLSTGSIGGWIHADVLRGGSLVLGGRNFDPSVEPTLTLSVASTRVATVRLAAARSFVHLAPLSTVAPPGTADYVPLTVAVSPASRVAIEQFDVSASRSTAGFGDGWHEPEYQPVTGRRWRWLSGRGELHLSRPMSGPAVLHLDGESPRRYFARPSRLVVRWRDRVLFDQSLSDDFSVDVVIPHEAATGDVIAVETDQTFVPADQSRRTHDRRQLGLRIFTCELRRPVPAS